MGVESKLTNESTRRLIVELENRYVGPAAGEDEVLRSRPDRAYLVGTLYPQESGNLPDPLETDDPPDVSTDPDDDPDELIAVSSWRPAAMAVSFLHDASQIRCSISAAAYERLELHDDPRREDASAVDGASIDDVDGPISVLNGHPAHETDEREAWRRHPLRVSDVLLDADAETQEALFDSHLMIAIRTRKFGALRLSTVSVRNLRKSQADVSQPPVEDCLFQVKFTCDTVDGRVHPYPSASAVRLDGEAQELALRYRGLEPLAVGHGVSATWERTDVVTRIVAEPLPVSSVQLVRAREDREDPVFDMKWLASEQTSEKDLRDALFGLVNRFGEWVRTQRLSADAETGRLRDAAERLAARAERAELRMRGSVKRMFEEPDLLTSFRLANRAMHDQMLRPGARKPGLQPRWRPFQLAFVLLALESTADSDHEDRDVVDLIWFETGGGKTEAYLFLTAFELIRRRLFHGVDGGGTAVITRYTLRLLTTQQFQRAASLICALELIRLEHQVLRQLPTFSIGLWVGGETTPNSYKDAHDWMKPIRKANRPVNRFQLDRCPWCDSSILPLQYTSDDKRYGVRASSGHFEFFCPEPGCPFHASLPVQVVDEGLYADPPSVLLATVDKFAQLAWRDDAGRLLGRGGVPCEPPSLIIQDELHLLSGPLGTTVAVYEAAIEALIAWTGVRPKVVASTATIRASESQVSGLFGRRVALFPSSGIRYDDDFFSEPDPEKSRVYLGLMPQAHTPSYATVRAAGELLQAPVDLELAGGELDSYWTLVGYHHSFRELGRTLTLVRDDVVNLLRARGADGHLRVLRSDNTVELTSHLQPADLVDTLRRMERPVTDEDAVDFVACTNMLSVGIDVGRLGLMLMNGQPKTNAEYIQATSRVGRAAVPGVVVTLFRSSRARDRSHYEGFFGFHEALYRGVEPTSVTPWSRRSRAAALIILMRHGAGLSGNDQARDFDPLSAGAKKARKALETIIEKVDKRELHAAVTEIDDQFQDWARRAEESKDLGATFEYYAKTDARLMRHALSEGDGWDVMDSMRSVEHMVRIESGRS